MTIEERYELSCYEELTRLDDIKKVWLVRHNETGTLYVKKKIELYNLSVYQRLMSNPVTHVPKVMLCIEDDSELIVVEEFIHGTSLEQILETDGVLTETQVIDIMMKLCDILAKLHSLEPPIIHRDIKPSNIMISNEGMVYLIDFNAAREISSERNEDTRLMGTRKFAAPEQYGFGQSDERTDIYAMGVTMYYLLTKSFPDSKSYNGRLLDIIERCVNIDKNRRYANVHSLKYDLMHIPENVQQQIEVEKNEEPQTNFCWETSYNTASKISEGKTIYAYNEKLPVGFRSGKLTNMAVGIIGYIMIIWLTFASTFKDKEGVVYTGYPLILNRIAAFLVLMGTVVLVGNYRNIKSLLPYTKDNKRANVILTILYLCVYYFGVIGLMVILGG